MKKILLNAYVDLNFGDDLFLKILFNRYPNVKWFLPKGGDKYKEIFKEYDNVVIESGILFKIRRKLGLVEKNRFFKRYDAGVYIGGSIFMQLPQWKEQLMERKEVISSFHSKGKPYFIIGSNFGPFRESEFLEEYTALFKQCKDICFRDRYSKNLFLNSNIRIAPDIVFQLKPKGIKKIENSIGISLIEVEDREELKFYRNIYISKVREIISKGFLENKNFTFFSFCENQGDLKIINEVIEPLDAKIKNKVKIVNYDGQIDDFLEKFETMETIIGSRFHACILSQVFNQGLYPLIYSDKTYNVLKDINLDRYYCYIQNIKTLDVSELLKIIENNKIKDRTIFQEAEKQFRELDKYVRGY